MGFTVVEKIAAARAGDAVDLVPDHVMTHDNSMAVIEKFRALGGTRVADPRMPVIVLDHDIQNRTPDHLDRYAAIEAFAAEQGVDFYPPGSGIGHQIVVERLYARPGGLVVASANGNLVSLRSPGEIEHIRYNTGFGPTAAEGYILCLYGALKAYDNAKVGAGFGPPTVIAGPTATGITIRRKTLDGAFRLDQKWSRDNAERDLTLEMTLKNLGPPVHGVELGRVTDVNVDYSLDGLFLDRFDRTRYTLWFHDQVNGRDSVTMKLLTLNPAYYVVVAKYEPAPECTYPQLAFPGGPQDVMGHARMAKK